MIQFVFVGKAANMFSQNENSEAIVDDAEMTNATTSKSTAETKGPAKPAAFIASVALPAIKIQSTDEYSALCVSNSPPDQPVYTKLEGKKDLPKIQNTEEYSALCRANSPPDQSFYAKLKGKKDYGFPAAPIYNEVENFASY